MQLLFTWWYLSSPFCLFPDNIIYNIFWLLPCQIVCVCFMSSIITCSGGRMLTKRSNCKIDKVEFIEWMPFLSPSSFEEISLNPEACSTNIWSLSLAWRSFEKWPTSPMWSGDLLFHVHISSESLWQLLHSWCK